MIFLVWSCVDKSRKLKTAILSDYLFFLESSVISSDKTSFTWTEMIYNIMYLFILSKYWIFVFINMHFQKLKVDIMQVQH